MPYRIRPAQTTDAPALADLLREVGNFAWINAQTPEEACARVSIHLAMCLADDSHSILVAGAEPEPDGLLGYVSVHWLPYLLSEKLEGYVSELFIRPDARGQGIGSALLESAVAEARRRGCGRMRLLNMRQRELYLRGYYKKHGWEEREDAATFQLAL